MPIISRIDSSGISSSDIAPPIGRLAAVQAVDELVVVVDLVDPVGVGHDRVLSLVTAGCGCGRPSHPADALHVLVVVHGRAQERVLEPLDPFADVFAGRVHVLGPAVGAGHRASSSSTSPCENRNSSSPTVLKKTHGW